MSAQWVVRDGRFVRAVDVQAAAPNVLERCGNCGGVRDHPALRWCAGCRRVVL